MSPSLAQVERSLVETIRSPEGSGIYRKLVRRGLAHMLCFMLPRTAAHLGPRWDRDVARFLDERLPRSHYLRDVAFELFEHAAPGWQGDPSVPPYVIELARHELLAFEVANAPDDPPPSAAAPLTLDRGVAFLSSMRLVRHAHAVHLLVANEGSLDPPAAEPTALCLYRDAEHEIRSLVLTPSAAQILERLRAGAALGEAVSGAAAALGCALDEPFLQGAARLLEDLGERGVVRGSM
jgi:hypothetical protein